MIRTPNPYPVIVFPTLFGPLTAIPATYFGSESLMERPARITWGVGAHLLCPLDTVVRVHGDTGPRVAR